MTPLIFGRRFLLGATMQSNWDFFYTQVLQSEGTGYEDVPGDSGGPTKCGVTVGDVVRYHGLKLAYDKNGHFIRGAKDWDKAVALVRDLDPGKAAEIYRRYYWNDIRADELPAGLDFATADYGTNSGESHACNVLAGLLGKPHTGAVTDEMLAACRAYPGGLTELIEHFQDERKEYLKVISTPPKYAKNVKFRKGWLAREARVRKQALDLAAAAPPLPPVPVPSPKAFALESMVSMPGTTATAVSSKSVWAIIVSVFTATMAHIHIVTHAIALGCVVAYQDFPDIISDTQGTVASVSSLSSLVGAGEIMAGGTLIAVSVVAALIAIERHVALKKQANLPSA